MAFGCKSTVTFDNEISAEVSNVSENVFKVRMRSILIREEFLNRFV